MIDERRMTTSGNASHRDASGRTALLGLLVAVVACLAQGVFSPAAGRKIVAIGDIHGAFDGLVTILQRAELIDEQHDWIGGDAVLVQTGDYFDRGLGVRQVIDLFRELEGQAENAGGQVVVLMGNHEAMNLLGFRRDVNPELYAEFLDGEFEESAYEERLKGYKDWLKARAKVRGDGRPDLSSAFEEQWREENPPGTFEYLAAIAPRTEYGAWLRQRPIVAEVGDFVFLHGGLGPNYVRSSLEVLNRSAREEIDRLDDCRRELLQTGVVHPLSNPNDMVREGLAQLRRVDKELDRRGAADKREELEYTRGILEHCVDYEDWFLVREDSPVWFRGYARWEEEEARALVMDGLATHRARAFVVGHTPQRSGEIQMRLNGRVFLIDTGMLAPVYKGRPSALVINGEKVTALYPDAEETLVSLDAIPPVQPHGRIFHSVDGAPLPLHDDDQVVAFLQQAEVELLEVTEKGINRPTKVVLRRGELAAYGVFRDVDIVKERFRDRNGRFFARFKDSYRFEVAAYELDRALGLGYVPPAVLRRVGGTLGSLQIWVQNVIDEEERREVELSPPDAVAFAHQGIMRRFFDNLIANFDRNLGNILIDKGTFRVWLIDHTRAFLEEENLLTPAEVTQIDRRVWRRFVDMDFDALSARLQGTLTRGEIKTLFGRWRAIETLLRGRIEELGEDTVLFDSRL